MATYTPLLAYNNKSIMMMKATGDPNTDGNWANVGGDVYFGQKVGGVKSMWAVEDGSDIHIVTQLENGDVHYHVFDPGTDLWTTMNEVVVQAGDTNFDNAPVNHAVSLALRSDGDVVVVAAYADATDETMRVFSRDGTTWTNRGEATAGTDTSNHTGIVVIGPDTSDRISWVYKEDIIVESHDDSGSILSFGDATEDERMAQGFQLSFAREITKVLMRVRRRNAPTDSVRLDIMGNDGLNPDEVSLGFDTVPAADITSVGADNNAWRFNNVFLNGTTQYHLVLSRTGALNDTDNYTANGPDPGFYPDGTMRRFRNASQIWVIFGATHPEDLLFLIIQAKIWIRSISSTNALSGETLIDIGGFADWQLAPGVIDADKIYISYIQSNDRLAAVSWTSAASPAPPSIDFNIGENDVEGNRALVPPFNVTCYAIDGSDVHLLYADDATQDIFHDDNVQAGGSTDVEVKDAVTCNRISANTYDRSGKKLAYVYLDGITSKYAEVDISAPPAPARSRFHVIG